MTIAQMRSALKSAIEAVDAFQKGVVDADGKPRDMTEEEAGRFDALVKDAETKKAALESGLRFERTKAFAAASADEPAADEAAAAPRAPAAPKVDLKGADKIGLLAMATVAAKFHLKGAHEQISPLKVLEENGFAVYAKEIDTTQRARREMLKTLNVSVAGSGGFLTPPNLDTSIIELLYPQTSFLQGNPRRVNMPGGVYSVPRGATGSSASYTAEGQPIAKTEPSFGMLNMTAKKLGAIIPMTREMIDFSIPGVRAFVESDLREAMSQAMDVAAYFGAGAAGEPLGIVNHTGVQSFDSASTDATPTIAEADTDFRRPILHMKKANLGNRGAWRWIMESRALEYMRTMRTTDGYYVYPELQGDNPTMRGIPILETENVPDNLGVGANEALILLVNFREVYLGVFGSMQFATSDEATINIGGSSVSAFENDLVYPRAIDFHDIGLRRRQAVVVTRKVLYGA